VESTYDPLGRWKDKLQANEKVIATFTYSGEPTPLPDPKSILNEVSLEIQDKENYQTT